MRAHPALRPAECTCARLRRNRRSCSMVTGATKPTTPWKLHRSGRRPTGFPRGPGSGLGVPTCRVGALPPGEAVTGSPCGGAVVLEEVAPGVLAGVLREDDRVHDADRK